MRVLGAGSRQLFSARAVCMHCLLTRRQEPVPVSFTGLALTDEALGGVTCVWCGGGDEKAEGGGQVRAVPTDFLAPSCQAGGGAAS